MRRRQLLGVVSAMFASATGVLRALAARSPRAPQAIGQLVEALAGARNYKVRIQAAALLARLSDPRAFQALGRAAATDRHSLVRSFVVRTLARNPGGDAVSAQQARLIIGRAMADRDPGVRRQAAVSMNELERRMAAMGAGGPAAAAAAGGGGMATSGVMVGPRRLPVVVAVGQMGDRSGRATRAMRERMRELLRALLRGEGKFQVADELSSPGVTYTVDGSISRFQWSTGGPDVEATCAVQLVISRIPGGIITMTSGEAAVQKPSRMFRPAMKDRMEADALEHAVRSAHESLAKFLAAQ
jgi:hypothetical protein